MQSQKAMHQAVNQSVDRKTLVTGQGHEEVAAFARSYGPLHLEPTVQVLAQVPCVSDLLALAQCKHFADNTGSPNQI